MAWPNVSAVLIRGKKISFLIFIPHPRPPGYSIIIVTYLVMSGGENYICGVFFWRASQGEDTKDM